MERELRIGVCGLGRGFMLTAPALIGDPRVRLVAAAEPRAEARARFERELGGRTYPDITGLVADPDVDVVYVASPHALHAPHAIAAARAGKHVLVDKPMALDPADCVAMIEAAREAKITLMVGPSHGYDAPVALAESLIAAGDYGRVRMATSLNYTDFLYRPRRPEELDTAQGGGVIFNQAPHQVDVICRLIGASVTSVRAVAGVWDQTRPTEGAYAAFLTFEGGAGASLTYSGYGRFDSDEFCDWIDELGAPKDPAAAYGRARRDLGSPAAEARRRLARAYGESGLPASAAQRAHEHFGLVIVSCERADLRLTANGVMVYGQEERRLHQLDPPKISRSEVIDELWGAVVEGRAPRHDGVSGLVTLQTCLAILASSREGREIELASGARRRAPTAEAANG
ncbi:MAG TPA: Gfo/Idh/MocA family oxidoreductase [Caulobacteraceae bacterium]|nr:Gfo/Idh/MocA family oxidoreductase [Caulobacteraceae bacterium]